jgi:hypothetical protein
LCFLWACENSAQKQNQQAQTGLAAQQTKASQFGLDTLKGSLPSALSFFEKLLSGDRSSVMGAIEPAVQSLTSQYEAGRVSENEFAPRGGGRTAADVMAPWQEEGQVSTLVSEAQTAGASGVVGIDQLLEGLTTGSAAGASATLGNQATSLNDQQQTQQAAGNATGQGIGSLIALLTL